MQYKLNPKVFILAAEYIDQRQHVGCCSAAAAACAAIETNSIKAKHGYIYSTMFRLIFSDVEYPAGYWMDSCDMALSLPENVEASRKHRVMALLMAAEIAKDVKYYDPDVFWKWRSDRLKMLKTRNNGLRAKALAVAVFCPVAALLIAYIVSLF